ncbi:SPOR domain-containing protein [Pseudoalteromonas sp. TB64]|uniref:SPOR domain-containing protein n=1 Tax=Pseudoalteromonas sp. TB64 TaxID=1938600 RepID=UPI00041636B2|nr:SPOR domain-containing protein [Pseudoalteromonas sp. TB64]
MLKYKKNNNGLLLSLLMLFFGTACTLLPEEKSLQHEQSDSPEYVSITALELAQLKDAAMQWQQARLGIERILKLEKEITYLVNHIDIINTKALAQSEQGHGNKYTRTPLETNTTKPQQRIKPTNSNKKQTVKLNAPKHVFALQVASVDSEKSVVKAWHDLNKQAAPLFRDKILTNVETANINNKTYYRLKLGSYQNLKNAKADCEVFKLYKLDCIVSNYTDKPVKL